VAIYDTEGQLLRHWGRQGKADCEFDCPGGIAVGRDGRVYVADQTNHRVQVFDGTGNFLLTWGEYGSGPGQFGGAEPAYARTGGPQFLALDAAGNVWTTEGMNCRVQQFTPEGKFLHAWGDGEDKTGHLGGFFKWADGKQGRLQGAIGICIDRQDQIWVSAVSGRVQQFTPDGRYVQGVGEGQGDGPGEFFIPHGMAMDSKGHLYVVDTLNHRVQQFAVRQDTRFRD
jgi:sugar lactone lactonase YvrE